MGILTQMYRDEQARFALREKITIQLVCSMPVSGSATRCPYCRRASVISSTMTPIIHPISVSSARPMVMLYRHPRTR